MLESECRRPDFLGGRPIVLGDGQAWFIPTPMLASQADLDRNGWDHETLMAFGPEFDRLVAAVRGAESEEEEGRASLALAVDLLRRNYDIPPDHFGRLLAYVVGESDPNQPLLEIFYIAIGQAPRTLARWCRLGAILAGVAPDATSLEDAYELASIQVGLGRHIPADKWVDEMVEEAKLAKLYSSLGCC